MSAGDFDSSVAIILKEEGGNDDDPRDPGGRTSRGITQREWDVFTQSHSGRPSDVWKASDADIRDIYLSNYWNPYCDELPAGMDLVFFNTSVNSGRTQAVRELQRACGVSVDGMMGMLTINAANTGDVETLIHSQCEQRRNFYRNNRNFSIYGKGWLARTDRIEASAIKLANDQPTTKHPETSKSPKAPTFTTAQPAVSPETGGGVTAGLFAIIAALQQVKDQLSGFAGTFTWVNYILLGITLVVGGYTVWAIIKRNRAQAVM